MLSIPNPCQENFEAMPKTSRGAWCQKCQTDTFDFRSMPADQIETILKKPGKKCGRIYPHQLVEFNRRFKLPKETEKLQARFLIALLFVFGVSLFSCSGEEESLAHLRKISSIKETTLLAKPFTTIQQNPIEILPLPTPDLVELVEPEYSYHITEETPKQDSYKTTDSGEELERHYLSGDLVHINLPYEEDKTNWKIISFERKHRLRNLFSNMSEEEE